VTWKLIYILHLSGMNTWLNKIRDAQQSSRPRSGLRLAAGAWRLGLATAVRVRRLSPCESVVGWSRGRLKSERRTDGRMGWLTGPVSFACGGPTRLHNWNEQALENWYARRNNAQAQRTQELKRVPANRVPVSYPYFSGICRVVVIMYPTCWGLVLKC
jgi:hypothetical protein